MKIFLIIAGLALVAVIASGRSRKQETFRTLDAVVEDTKERIARGEYDD